MPFRIGPTELIIVLVIIMIIFGVGRLPQVGGAIGKGIREFRKAQRGDEDEAASDPSDEASKEVKSSRSRD